MSNLRELLEQAASDIDTYKNPDISEAAERLSEILEAADLGKIRGDVITRLRIGRDNVEIETQFYIRQCEQSRDYEFPATILDASDPVASARQWGLLRKQAKAADALREAERTVKWRKEALAKIETELASLTAADEQSK